MRFVFKYLHSQRSHRSLVLAAEDAEVALDQLGAHPPPVEQRGGALAVASTGGAAQASRRPRRRCGSADAFLVVVVVARRALGRRGGAGAAGAAATARRRPPAGDVVAVRRRRPSVVLAPAAGLCRERDEPFSTDATRAASTAQAPPSRAGDAAAARELRRRLLAPSRSCPGAGARRGAIAAPPPLRLTPQAQFSARGSRPTPRPLVRRPAIVAPPTKRDPPPTTTTRMRRQGRAVGAATPSRPSCSGAAGAVLCERPAALPTQSPVAQLPRATSPSRPRERLSEL